MRSFHWGLPVQASSYAGVVDTGIGLLHVVMAAIFIVWGVFLAVCLVRYRSRDGRRAQYAEKGVVLSLLPDALVLIFELVLVVVYGVPVWARIKQSFPSEKESTVIRVVAEQFAWNVHYPGPDGRFGRTDPKLISPSNGVGLDRDDPAAKDDVITTNEIHMPLGKPTLIFLSSKDVIHSFFVPEFRLKQDVVPGMVIPVWVEPIRAGKYEVGCAQLCGLGHYRMRGDVYAESQGEFDRWVRSRKETR